MAKCINPIENGEKWYPFRNYAYPNHDKRLLKTFLNRFTFDKFLVLAYFVKFFG